jgi:hypothetical protein
MAHPGVCGRRDGLQLWRIAANILNKLPRTNNNGWSSSSVGIVRSRTKATELVS